jgi:antitoxin ParD1/3/4
MPRRTSRTVSLPVDFENFIRQQMHTGRYATASEVIRAALRLLEQQQRQLDATPQPRHAIAGNDGVRGDRLPGPAPAQGRK